MDCVQPKNLPVQTHFMPYYQRYFLLYTYTLYTYTLIPDT